MTSAENDIQSEAEQTKRRGLLDSLGHRLDRFGNREWFAAGLITQVLLLALAHLILTLLPREEIKPPQFSAVTELKFVEYQEIRTPIQNEARDLSDKIIEKEKLEKEQKINWDNATNPLFDATQRYRPMFFFNYSSDDYPNSARRSNLPSVTVNFTMLIGPDGKIKDLRINRIRSRGDSHKAYEKDFIKAVRRIILHQTSMKTRPFTVGGVARPFQWTTNITFTLR